MQSSTTTAPTRGRLPVARRDRRPALAALAVLLILLGALGSALIAFRSGDRVAVLVAAHTIPVGKEITADDLTTMQVSADTDSILEDFYEEQFVGTHAISMIPEGTLVNARMFGVSAVPTGAELVGITVDPTRRTSEVPQIGDVVKIYYVSNSTTPGGSDYAPGAPVVLAARVMDVGGGGSSGITNVTVLVKESMAGEVAAYAASGNLAITVLPPSTVPVVETLTK